MLITKTRKGYTMADKKKGMAAAIDKFNSGRTKTSSKCFCDNGKIAGKTCIACGGTGRR
jgi:hypothetical protein